MILVCGYKWLGESKIHTVSISQEDCKRKSDYEVSRKVRDLLDEADVVIAHNGDAFDIKVINTRLLYHKLSPPSPFRTIDTKKVSRANFGMPSNKLEEICTFLGEGQKVRHTGFDLWMGFMAGNKESRRLMIKYNIGDIVLLERAYKRFLPFIKNHPNINAPLVARSCPRCKSSNMQSRGFCYSKTTMIRKFKCNDCGGWSTVGKSVKINEVRSS